METILPPEVKKEKVGAWTVGAPPPFLFWGEARNPAQSKELSVKNVQLLFRVTLLHLDVCEDQKHRFDIQMFSALSSSHYLNIDLIETVLQILL